MLFGSSVELQCTSLCIGPEKTFENRCNNSSPRYMRENHYVLDLFSF